MGARSSKHPPHSIQPEVTAVEMFEDTTPDESNNHKWHTTAPALGSTISDIGTVGQHAESNGSEPANSKAEEKQKKKRRRSKKEKNKPSSEPPKLSPQVRQQHFEQIKDAYALDEEAKKAPTSDICSRFLDTWRKTPQTPSDKSDDTPASLTRSLTATVPRALFASSGRSSEEMSNDVVAIDRTLALDDVESLPLPPASRTSAITRPVAAATPSFLAPSNQYDYGRPDIQTTLVIRVKTSDRKTPEWPKRSMRSDLRLDDVDEDLMEHILTNDNH